ncbi:MAG: molybdenum cofactor biosynthesis protein MoaE [Candidatus Eisenbacteria bacterium]|nr:molybdenum cofactor biosynthesis protein MoaE [Candidatus Eisenbacteria bacterium]
MAELTHAPIDVAPLLAAAARPECGAVNLFLGTTRDHHEGRSVLRLEYEAHEGMALAALRVLEDEARTRFELAHVVVVHRLGVVPVAEASVAVVVSTPHRAPAFEASRWIMDELKRRVPIWKKEHFADGGAEWVKGHVLE